MPPKLAPWGDLPRFILIDPQGHTVGESVTADSSRRVTLANTADCPLTVAIAALFDDGNPGPPITRYSHLDVDDTLSCEVTLS